jgi:anti-sigma-K factor RskA
MMEQEEKNIDLIEAYVKGTLSERERADFEKRQAEDPEFASAVEDYALIMKEINTSQAQHFAQKLKTWDDEIADRETRVIPLRRILAIAATVLITVLAGGYLFSRYGATTRDNQQLFTAYFKPYPDAISQRSAEPGPLEQGMALYNQGDYVHAIPLLKTYIENNPHRDATCYLGISYLATDQTSDAKTIFSDLLQHEPDMYTEIAAWNLALVHLKLKENELLKTALEEIINQPTHLFRSQAKSLYDEYF